MMAEIFNAADIVNKTLIAQTKVPVYRYPYSGAEIIGYINPGNPVGVVYSYLSPDAAKERDDLFWMFAPAPGGASYYYTEQKPGYYSVSALKQQGVISTEEKIKQEQEKQDALNQPWYMNMLKTALPWVAGIAIAAVVINKKL